MSMHPSNGTVTTTTAEGQGGVTGRPPWSQDANRRASVEAEVQRVKLLPPSSSYAVHRLRVLNKVMQLLNLAPQARSSSESEELELLFSSLSI